MQTMRSRGPLTLGFIAAVFALAIVAAMLNVRSTGAQAATNTIALDADTTTATIDTARTVNGSATFTIGSSITAAGTAYVGYQTELSFPDAGLNFVSGTQLSPSSLSLCGALQAAPPSGGNEIIQSGCAKTGAAITFTGPIETYDLACATDGTFTVTLLTLAQEPNFGTTTLDSTAAAIPTSTQNITITCTGVGGGVSTPTTAPAATNTPVPAATNTAVATSTNVPAATNTPVPVATNTPAPGATNTSVPTVTNTAVATNTSVPGATNTPVPTSTNTPPATNTPAPGATNTTVPQATNTTVPQATNTTAPQATNTTAPQATNTSVPGATNTPGTGGECVPPGRIVSLFIGITFRLGAHSGNARYNPRYDLNRNGTIGMDDLAIVLKLQACHGTNGRAGDILNS